MYNKYDLAYQEMVVEMFKRVGVDKSYEEIKEFAQEPTWYATHTWTKQEEDNFIQWLVEFLRGKLKYTKKQATRQAHWFVCDIGWKVVN